MRASVTRCDVCGRETENPPSDWLALGTSLSYWTHQYGGPAETPMDICSWKCLRDLSVRQIEADRDRPNGGIVICPDTKYDTEGSVKTKNRSY
jgi:hypothetical protein